MKPNKNDKICGIYCIKNKVNNKVYIGKSKNYFVERIKIWRYSPTPPEMVD